MNERNVAALAALLREYLDAPATGPAVCIAVDPGQEIAEFLAARGVLVPETIQPTDIGYIEGRHYDAAQPNAEYERGELALRLAAVAAGINRSDLTALRWAERSGLAGSAEVAALFRERLGKGEA